MKNPPTYKLGNVAPFHLIKVYYKNICIFPLLIFFSIITLAQNRTYYISTLGDDSNNGLSVASSWKTVSKVSSYNFQVGDKILFEGGQTFTGNLELHADDGPLEINCYGKGKAIINAGGGIGIYALNVGGIEIHNIVLAGSGSDNNRGSGIFFDMSRDNDEANIIIDSTEVYGFGECGIVFGATGTSSGYKNVQIINNTAHDNGTAGITTYGNGSLYNHGNFYVANNITYNNLGRKDITNTNTGSGIVLAGIDGFVIERCVAYENGADNRHEGGGPVGIWCYNARNGVIQYCESHHNKAGLQSDGGGFDIDGGSQDCVIQYNYSHDNEGPGFALFEYGSPNRFLNNTIRYNISENDGLKNSAGGLAFWAKNAKNKITNSQVYNNVIYATNAAIGAAVAVANANISNLKVFNNIFYCAGVPILKGNPTAILWQNNNYYSTGTPNFTGGGTTVDPRFVNPGGGIYGYRLSSSSPLIDAGLPHGTLKDLYGNSVSHGAGVDIGAYESGETIVATITSSEDDGNVATNTMDGKINTRWSAKGDSQWIMYHFDTIEILKTVKIAWYRGDERKAFFDIQISLNGENWNTVFAGTSTGETTAMEEYIIDPQLARYVRIVGHGNNVSQWNAISEVQLKQESNTPAVYKQRLKNTMSLKESINHNDIKVWPNPAVTIVSLKISAEWLGSQLTISDLSGKIMLQKVADKTLMQINLGNNSKGIYVLKLNRNGKTVLDKFLLQ